MEYVIEDTKTNAGTRILPMTDDVYECFKKIVENRSKSKVEPIIGGRRGFLYLDKNGRPMGRYALGKILSAYLPEV